MNVFNIITHLGVIAGFVKNTESVIAGCIQEKRTPTKPEWISVIDGVRGLLDSGVIDIPGVDEKSIADGLKSLEDSIQ